MQFDRRIPTYLQMLALIGAIGISGGSVDEDTAIAQHCRDRFPATIHSTR